MTDEGLPVRIPGIGNSPMSPVTSAARQQHMISAARTSRPPTNLPRRLRAFVSVVVVSALFCSCRGGAGSWDDDSNNWGRAFGGQTKSPDVAVTHSRYWKSPHFTYEAEYFFQLTCPQKFLDAWIDHVDMTRTSATEANTPRYFNRPSWFTPGPLQDYEMWMPASEPYSKFRIYRQRSSGTVFVTDCST